MEAISHILFYTLIAIVFSSAMGAWDAHRSQKKLVNIDHPGEFLTESVVYIVVGFLVFFDPQEEIMPSFLVFFWFLVMAYSIRWFFHDLAFNVVGKKPLVYQGDGKNDAFTDWFIKKNAQFVGIHPFVLKVVYCVLCYYASFTLLNSIL